MHSICNLKYSVPKKIPEDFYNGSNYDYHFTIKDLAEEFKKQFTCLREINGKYINFIIFPDSKRLKIVWINILTFSKRRISIIL